jgi:hypothetical protein
MRNLMFRHYVFAYTDRSVIPPSSLKSDIHRLCFQSPESIYRAFGITFDKIVEVVEKIFEVKLMYNVKLEQRRMTGTRKNDSLIQFKSAVQGNFHILTRPTKDLFIHSTTLNRVCLILIFGCIRHINIRTRSQ